MPELAVKRTPAGPVGAVGFDGFHSHLVIPSQHLRSYDFTKSWMVVARARVDGFPVAGRGGALAITTNGLDGAQSGWYAFMRDDGLLVLGAGDGVTTEERTSGQSANRYATGTWAVVGIGYDAATRKGVFYIGGELVESATAFTINFGGGNRDHIGAEGDATNNQSEYAIRGALSLWLMYDRIPTAAEFASIDAGRVPRAGLQVGYDFRDPRWHTATISDISGNNRIAQWGSGVIPRRVPGPAGKYAAPDRLGLDLTFSDWPHDRDLSGEWIGRVYVITPTTGATVRVTKDPTSGKSVLVCDSLTDGTNRTASIFSSAEKGVYADVRGAASVRLNARVRVAGIVQGPESWNKAYWFGRGHGAPAGANTLNNLDGPSVPEGTVPMTDYDVTRTVQPNRAFFVTSGSGIGNSLCQGKSEWEYVRVEPTLRAPVAGRTVRKR